MLQESLFAIVATEDAIFVFGCLIAIITLGVMIERKMNKSDSKDECRRKALDRLRKPSGWQPLDAINAKLYDAYRRLDSHE